jgi:hypothetical protein
MKSIRVGSEACGHSYYFYFANSKIIQKVENVVNQTVCITENIALVISTVLAFHVLV